MRERDTNDATAILQRIRRGEDPDSILRHLHTGDLLLELHVTPEAKPPGTFPGLPRVPRALQTPDNAYLHSLVQEASIVSGSPSSSSSASEVHGRTKPQFSKPYAAVEVVDPRLDLIKPSEWTNVLTDDDLMRNMLRCYFRHEYQSLPFFHKDFFLDDMISGSLDFCSSLLVNALLAEACVSTFWSSPPIIWQVFSFDAPD